MWTKRRDLQTKHRDKQHIQTNNKKKEEKNIWEKKMFTTKWTAAENINICYSLR